MSPNTLTGCFHQSAPTYQSNVPCLHNFLHSDPQSDPWNSFPWEASTKIFSSTHLTWWYGCTQPPFWEAINSWLSWEYMFLVPLETTFSIKLFSLTIFWYLCQTILLHLLCHVQTSQSLLVHPCHPTAIIFIPKMTNYPKTGGICGQCRYIELHTTPCLSLAALIICRPHSVSWSLEHFPQTTLFPLPYQVLKHTTQYFGCICSISSKTQNTQLLETPMPALTVISSGEPCGWCVSPALYPPTAGP